MVEPIYLDNHATTPMDPRVLEAMLPFFAGRFGNAASRSHTFGTTALDAVNLARAKVGALIGAERPEREIVFTSGATESNNLALKGVVEAMRGRGDHVITQPTEHKAVLDTCRYLEQRGIRVTYLSVDGIGRVDPDELRRVIDDRTVLVSVMLANNEVGTIQPVAELARMTHDVGALFHCDAAQGVGLVELSVDAASADLVSLSAHKMYGPKGAGALYVRRSCRTAVAAQIHGGGHELGFRSGTLNVPAIVGFGEAADIMRRDAEAGRIRALRDDLYGQLRHRLDGVTLNGPVLDGPRHPGNLNVSFADLDGEALLVALSRTVAVSSGSACSSATIEPSYVLRAMGVDDDRAYGSVRFGVGRFTTSEEIDRAAETVVAEVIRLRSLGAG